MRGEIGERAVKEVREGLRLQSLNIGGRNRVRDVTTQDARVLGRVVMDKAIDREARERVTLEVGKRVRITINMC